MQILAVVVLGTTGMGGCAATDQIEFQGKIFEMAGLTNREKKETVPVERAPLVIPPSQQLFRQGVELYIARPDKDRSLTDCISFVTMRQHGLTDALTGDRHFEQAGFNTLLLS